MLLILGAFPTWVKVDAQPTQGDWVVTSKTMVQNESIVLNGNLTVESGGNLTLRGVTLSLNVQRDGEYGIFVEAGGSLYIYDSTIASANQQLRFAFFVNGTRFVMEESSLQDAGWCVIQDIVAPITNCGQGDSFNGDQGLIIYTDNALIQNDTISNSGSGITFAGTNDIADDNDIFSNQYSAITIANPQNLWSLAFANDTVEGNTIHQNVLLDTAMVFLYSAGNRIENNTFGYTQSVGDVTLWAIQDAGGMDNTIRYNNITSTGGIFVIGGVSGDKISSNLISFCEAGVWLANDGSGNFIEGNTIVSGLVRESNGHICGGQGIQIRGARYTTVANNSVIAPKAPQTFNATFNPFSAIQLVQVFNGEVLNNNFSWIGQTPSLYLLDSSNNVIKANRLTDTQTSAWAGIFLEASNNNSLVDNALNSAAQYSIALDSSNNNLIHSNDFTSKQELAYDDGLNNSWSFQDSGNYWGTYSGTGPFLIPPNGVDGHPLYAPAKITPARLPAYSPIHLPQKFSGTFTKLQVSNTVVIKGVNATYEAGNFDVESGGNLTFQNSNLAFGTGDSLNVLVANGGAFSILNSNITWGTGGIQVSSGSVVRIENTTITVIGTPITAVTMSLSGSMSIEKSTLQSIQGSGGFNICATTPDVSLSIVDSVLSGGSNCSDTPSTIKIGGDYSDLTIENNTIENSPAGIELAMGPHNTVSIINNTFRGLAFALEGTAGSAIVSHNIVYSSTEGLIFTASNVTVDYNTLIRSWNFGIGGACGNSGEGIPCEKVYDTVGNTAENILNGGLIVSANASLIANNKVVNSTFGLFIFGNGNNVTENTVNALGIDGQDNLIYHNNILGTGGIEGYPQGNSWSFNGEGNYWAGYTGKDPDLGGIGDTPYTVSNVTDSFPYMQPDGWLTQFYLTLKTNLPSATSFQINGTSFSVGDGGTAILRLGYVAAYSIAVPQTVKLANGSVLGFSAWGDGATSAARTIKLSANSTIEAVYALQASTTTITSSSSTTKTTSVTTTPVPEFPTQFLVTTFAFSIALTALLLATYQKTNLGPRPQP